MGTAFRLPRRALAGIGGAVVLVTLSGCFTTAADYRADAEAYLLNDAELAAALFPDGDAEIAQATCDDPVSQAVGSTFACRATDTAGGEWEFEVVITATNEYTVNVARFPDAP